MEIFDSILTLKAPVTTAADDIHTFSFFSEKIRLDVSSEIGRGFTRKIKPYDKSKKLKYCLLQFLFGALRANSLHFYADSSADNLLYLLIYCPAWGWSGGAMVLG